MRREKEKMEEAYKSVSLKYEISQQKQQALENDAELHRKSAQMHERQIEQLTKHKFESGAAGSSSATTVSTELMADENQRLRAELDSLTADNTKLGDEVRKLEDEISNLKSSLRMSELKFETLSGNTECFKVAPFSFSAFTVLLY